MKEEREGTEKTSLYLHFFLNVSSVLVSLKNMDSQVARLALQLPARPLWRAWVMRLSQVWRCAGVERKAYFSHEQLRKASIAAHSTLLILTTIIKSLQHFEKRGWFSIQIGFRRCCAWIRAGAALSANLYSYLY